MTRWHGTTASSSTRSTHEHIADANGVAAMAEVWLAPEEPQPLLDLLSAPP